MASWQSYPLTNEFFTSPSIHEVAATRDIQLLSTILSIFMNHAPVLVCKSGTIEAANQISLENQLTCHSAGQDDAPRRSRAGSRAVETDYFNSREPSRSRTADASTQQTPRVPSPSPAAPYLIGLSSNFSQFLPFSNSMMSTTGFGDRERRVSESPSWAEHPDVRPSPAPVHSNLRLPNRSASPRRDSFRQQLFGKPLGSSHDSQYAASIRSATDVGSLDSFSAQNSRMNRVSFGSRAPPQDTMAKNDSEISYHSTSSKPEPHVKSWRTVLDLNTANDSHRCASSF